MFCVPLQFICWNLISKVMVFGSVVAGKLFGDKGGALTNGISAHIKEALEISPLPLLPGEDREKMAVYEPKT